MLHDRATPSEANDFQALSAALILDTHRRLLGHSLLPELKGDAPGVLLYDAPFVILAHDTAADPVFFYANRTAQRLFEMSWEEIVHLPSRHSAGPVDRHERQRLLDRVAAQGYIDDYAGIRVSKTGQRFMIRNAVVWNLTDHRGELIGQAAAFSQWTMLT